jgi:hypothetical protein
MLCVRSSNHPRAAHPALQCLTVQCSLLTPKNGGKRVQTNFDCGHSPYGGMNRIRSWGLISALADTPGDRLEYTRRVVCEQEQKEARGTVLKIRLENQLIPFHGCTVSNVDEAQWPEKV